MNICLHWSAIAGSFECARELTFGSSDPQINAKNKFGETPLYENLLYFFLTVFSGTPLHFLTVLLMNNLSSL